MKKINYILIFLCLGFIYEFNAQTQQALLNRTKHWRFGHKAGLDINMTTGVPTVFNGSNGVVFEGNACISDTLGNLLFYCNGDTIWNKNHQPMLNGTLLNSDKNTQVAAQIMPRPGNPNQYFVFVNGCINDNCSFKLQYSVVDMTLDGGNGAVVPGQKNILVRGQTYQNMAFTKHSNGIDYWLAYAEYIMPPINETQTIFMKVTSSGPDTTNRVVSGIEDNGMKRFSPDGTKLASDYRIYSFNNNTAALTNTIQLPTDSLGNYYSSYSFEFSPDSKKLYYGLYSGGVYNCLFQQFDLSIFTQTAIASSVYNFYDSYTYYSFRGVGHLQLGPNGKIYIARTGGMLDSLHIIHNPNASGSACNFEFNGFYLDNICNFSLPIYPDYYFNNIPLLTSIGEKKIVNKVAIYPNPCNNELNINLNQNVVTQFLIFDMQGKLIFEKSINAYYNKIDLSYINDGVYILKINNGSGSSTQKLIVNH